MTAEVNTAALSGAVVVNAMAIVAEYLLRRQATYAEAEAALAKARAEGRSLTDAELTAEIADARKAVNAIGG